MIRILLADDHAVVRRGLRLVLESEPDLQVVSEAADGAEAVRQAVAHDVDLAVLDVTMPRMGGLQAAQEIARLRPNVKLLMLSVHDDDQYLQHARRAGAHGYVPKSVADHDLIDACRQAVDGADFIQPARRRRAVPAGPAPVAGPAATSLTPREAEILALIAEGNTAREIAEMLVISHRTVERHRENLLAKLGLRNSTELTRYAIRIGLVTP